MPIGKNKLEKGHKLTLLIILDGFGLSRAESSCNAITPETAVNIFGYIKEYPSSELNAHGEHVGLFPGQAGNSEAGHLNIGAGRVVKQDIVMISDAIKDGTFFKNEAFHQGIFHAQKYKAAVHVMGLLTDGDSAHAYPDHLYALLEYFRKHGQKKVFLHIFTDGRDSSPHAAVHFLSDLRKHMNNGEKIASVIGRFYAMDRNKSWDRTIQAYDALVCGKGLMAESAESAVVSAYDRGESDEYIKPTVIVENGKPVSLVNNNDVVYFFNARSDRARQLTKAFVQDDFLKKNPHSFKRICRPGNIRFVAMTDFGPDLPGIFTAFPSPDIEHCLADAIGDQYRQLYISESEKYAHITYFINGGYPNPINGEHREHLRSSGVYSYADNPGMRTSKVAGKILEYIGKNMYDFIAVNFPNADMVGHTGSLKAAKRAVKILDNHVRRIADAVLKKGGQALITADHGNAERMFDIKSGEMITEHTTNPVPFIIISDELKGKKMRPGKLADVAPTLLKLMGVKKPREMTGHSLI